MRAVRILSAALLTAVAGNGGAQTKQPAPKADSGCTTFGDGRIECVRLRFGRDGDSALRRMFLRNDSAMMNRAALGVELRATGTRRDTLGVFVAAVTRGGPAETAGVIEGDRIAAINGVDLRSAAADIEDPYTNGIASHRLTREVQKLTPGTRVTLRVYSGGRFRDVVVTTGRASEVMREAGGFNFRRILPRRGLELREPARDMIFVPGGAFRIERLDPSDGARIRALPRKSRVTT